MRPFFNCLNFNQLALKLLAHNQLALNQLAFSKLALNKTSLTLFILAAISPQLFAGDVLKAHFSEDLTSVNAELCFDGEAPKRLYRNSQASADIFHQSKVLKIREYDGTVRLPELPHDSCLSWQVQIDTSRYPGNSRTLRKAGDDLIMSANIWFWQGPQNRDLKVLMRLPKGIAFSTPWKYLSHENGVSIYQPDNTPPNWEAKLAIGQFEIIPVDIPAARLRLAMPGNLSAQQQQTLTSWVQESATSVSLVSGRFPQLNPQVLIIPAGNGGRADRFGQVLRGGGVAATFYVNESRPLQEFRDGWTATHEFSHMLLPYISSRDRWLSEGLASYYQNTLRARDGRLSATSAWQGLYDGFERGRQSTTSGTLAEATRQGRAATMRIYWSGAALMLMADMQLRETGDGQQSLDTALASLAQCCLDNGETWRASEMFKQLDSLTNTQVFSGLYDKYVNTEGFPDMADTWRNLGIEIRNNRVSLLPNAPLLTVRKEIMTE